MIIKYGGVNISSKDPKVLVEFYKDILAIPVIEDDENYDGVVFGFFKDAPVIWIWDENKWGKSSEGAVNLVFNVDSLEKTHFDLKEKGLEIDPIVIASWGGKELKLLDPDGNKILLLEE